MSSFLCLEATFCQCNRLSLPDRFDRESILQSYLKYGLPGLKQQLEKVYELKLPELHFVDDAASLIRVLALAHGQETTESASLPGLGVMLFSTKSAVRPRSFWHEVGHILQAAGNTESYHNEQDVEEWCAQFGQVMAGEQAVEMALIGPSEVR